ncbi:BQ5605_C026g10181 [Microbotryum silenes-dioicae]|uniref:BQ5605_C026g10181 protein n=1 Tax=Microbotryum silenes-dioicae TaxID=796604 RepID=A0A2X0NFJ3_9BASI|nr:BQ5605_C026g10181 [Microbotryum silenes-dioicae]
MRAAWRRRFGLPKPCLHSANWYYNLGAIPALCLSSTSDHARISLPAPHPVLPTIQGAPCVL